MAQRQGVHFKPQSSLAAGQEVKQGNSHFEIPPFSPKIEKVKQERDARQKHW